FECRRVAAEPFEAGAKVGARAPPSTKTEGGAVESELLVPGLREKVLMELEPRLDANLLHGRCVPQMAGSYTHRMAQAPVLPRGFELPLEPRLPRIGSVDAVALEERAASLARRSIKREAKVFALDLAIRMMDLTTLEGQDTPGKVAALASKAMRPDP